MPSKIIGYIRVSTQKQGDSGLGLDGQRTTIKSYAKQQGADIVNWYCEVESGRNATRPELVKAIAHAKHEKAQLVVAKLDRLARDVQFTSTLVKTGADFVACDNPHANKLTIHILSAIAEHEAEQISQRTKSALAAAKARGQKLGSHRPGHWAKAKSVAGRREGLRKAVIVASRLRSEQARSAYAHLTPQIVEMHEQKMSLRQIAAVLNGKGHTTSKGRVWNPVQVSRVLRLALPNSDT